MEPLIAGYLRIEFTDSFGLPEATSLSTARRKPLAQTVSAGTEPWIRFWEERSPRFLSSDISNPLIKRTRRCRLGLLESCHQFRTVAAAGHVRAGS